MLSEKYAGDPFILARASQRTVVDAYLSKTYDSTDPLSGRERQVLQLVGEGKVHEGRVAAQLGISVKNC